MDKFINQYVQPLLQEHIPAEQLKDRLDVLESDLKIFVNTYVKNQTAIVNKELAKKSRQLFLLSSDNQSLKQNLEQALSSLQTSKSQLTSLQNQKSKQKILYDKQIAQLNMKMEGLEKQMKKEMARLKMQREVLQQSHKVKIKQIRNDHQQELNNAIDNEKKLQQEQSQLMKKQFQDDKAHIIKQNNEKKKQLIGKYEQKISKITSEYEDKMFLLNKQYQTHKSESKSVKLNFQNRIVALENHINKLKIQLSKQQQSHKKYLQLYNNAYSQLSDFQKKALNQKQKIEQQLYELRKNLTQQERRYTSDIKDLNNLLSKTIQEKDTKFTETVETMETQFRIKYQSMETELIQEREIAVTNVEIKRDKENYDHQMKEQALKQQLQALRANYNSISSEYEQKFKKMSEQQEDFITGLNNRREYELSVNGKNAEREFNSLKNKYQLQIKAIYAQHNQHLEQLLQKHNDQKIALVNKLTTQYESMINDQKASNEIQIKQKLIQFDRKAKGFEAKLKDGQKKRNELKVAAERVKMEMQMRVDSMVELNEVYQAEVASMTEKVQNSEREKQRIINDYELKILIIKNEMKITKQEFQQREVELKELLESKLNAKNAQLNRILTKVKKQTETLVQAHEKRVQALEKQYTELKRVMGQKTSLPEDIEALKVFHGAYIDKQKQLKVQKQKVELLYRQLRAKDAIDKVFAEKGSKKIHKLEGVLPGTSTLGTFRSQQL